MSPVKRPKAGGGRRDPFLVAIEGGVEASGGVRDHDSILVAVSGGPDSVALLAALAELGRWKIAAAHVNHALRGAASERDERFVRGLADRLGVAFFVRRARVRPGANLEERAREKRYAALLTVARRRSFRWIATAHTLDDQAETVLLRLLRGAGTTGLGGIAPSRRDGVIRPMLGVARHDVLRFLERRGLRFRSDASNRSLRFTRNRIRHRLLPLLERDFNPAVRRSLARTAELLRDDELYLEIRAGEAARGVVRGAGLDGSRLRSLPPALRRRVVRSWLAAERGSLTGVGAEHVERIQRLAGERRGRVSVPGGTVVHEGDVLRWARRTSAARPRPYRIRLPEGVWVQVGSFRLRMRGARSAVRPGPWRAVFDRTLLDGGSLEATSPRPGDRIRPLGLGGTKKLQDVFVDAKVPRDARASWPVIRRENQAKMVLWVPGLVRSEAAPLGATSRLRLVIEAKRD